MSQPNAIEGIFFDLDGTLLDTSEDFIFTVNKMLADDNMPAIDSELIRSHVSEGSRKLVQLAYGLEPSDPKLESLRSRLLDEYNEYINNDRREKAAKLYDGMPMLLDTLDDKAIPWGVVTNKPSAYAKILLDQADLSQRSKTLICPDHVKLTKPNPEALLVACQQTDANPAKCIYIGDHLRDIEAGRNAGMVTIAALYGFISPIDTPDQWHADYNVSSAEEILPLLEKYKWQLPRRATHV
ncbi:HAD-IA family hydrolase [Endozoicomonas sp. 8E]|uniref:HAD family hydrolase n=1 Tax=Endozoicomonas sp. 8E TaxID=3035692 RepID=UPI00293917BB|nr:HAD-IA family hydrolase [Endozoicomonas sp. 8E]WOG30186.1 HAD-IA family hydrolase [Endozoicomonas sp. 8E]